VPTGPTAELGQVSSGLILALLASPAAAMSC